MSLFEIPIWQTIETICVSITCWTETKIWVITEIDLLRVFPTLLFGAVTIGAMIIIIRSQNKTRITSQEASKK